MRKNVIALPVPCFIVVLEIKIYVKLGKNTTLDDEFMMYIEI